MFTTVPIKDTLKKIKRLPDKSLFRIVLGLIILNVLLAFAINNLSDTGAYHLNGEYIESHSSELIMKNLQGIVISFPIFCLFIGAITAIFINREQPYKNRFLKGYLLTLIVVYAYLSIAGVFKIIILL